MRYYVYQEDDRYLLLIILVSKTRTLVTGTGIKIESGG